VLRADRWPDKVAVPTFGPRMVSTAASSVQTRGRTGKHRPPAKTLAGFKWGSRARKTSAIAKRPMAGLPNWKPMQDFQAPPHEVDADCHAEGDFHQLNDQLVPRHGLDLRCSTCGIASGGAMSKNDQ
jgi:hypothetical protein